MKIRLILFTLMMMIGLNVGASGNLSSFQVNYMYNFLRLVSWPENSIGENFVIGVLGDNETYKQLSNFTANRKVGTKLIIVKEIRTVEEAAMCQLVFVPENNSSKITDLKSRLGNKPCLIVSEKEGTAASGSTIEFVVVDGKLKFRVHEERAKQQNLMVSRTLLDMSI